jgi:type I restriction enzyme S subunit
MTQQLKIQLQIGWTLATIADIGQIQTGSTPPKANPEYYGGKFPIFKPTDLNSNFAINDAGEHLSEQGKKVSRIVTAQSTYVTCIGATIGKTGFVTVEGTCNQQINTVSPYKLINPKWLYYWLISPTMNYEIISNSSSTTLPIINKSRFSSLSTILVPQAEQKVIADKLDTLLAQVETTKARLDRIPQILKTFRQSVLAAAVSGKLTEEWRGQNPERSITGYLERVHDEREKLKGLKKLKKSFGPKKSPDPLFASSPEGWEWVSFEHIAENDNNALKAGPFGSALKKSDCIESGYKVYGQEQVIAGNEQLATYYVNDEKFQQLLSCSVKAGDILISLVGTIGKVLILSESAEQGIINPRLVKLSLHEDISRAFIKFYLNSPIALGFFKGFSHGGTMDILNLGILKELPIALPPIGEQTEIVRRVEQLFAHADKIEQQVQAAQQRVDKLTQSILAKAFRGELTAQWRKDNPELISGDNSSEALLEKIKAEREAKSPKKKAKTKKAKA